MSVDDIHSCFWFVSATALFLKQLPSLQLEDFDRTKVTKVPWLGPMVGLMRWLVHAPVTAWRLLPPSVLPDYFSVGTLMQPAPWQGGKGRLLPSSFKLSGFA